MKMFLFIFFPFQLAKLTPDDMNTVNNMKYLGGLDSKKATGRGFSLKFDGQKVKLMKLYILRQTLYMCPFFLLQ